MFDKNVSVLYPQSEIDAYSVDNFCIADFRLCILADNLARLGLGLTNITN